MISLLEQINIAPSIWKMFYFQPKSSLPSRGMTAVLFHYCFSWLCQPLAFWSNIAGGGLDHLDNPQIIMLVHYIDDIMLIGPAEQEVVKILNILVEHTHSRG